MDVLLCSQAVYMMIMRNRSSAVALIETVANAKPSDLVLACLIWGATLAIDRDKSLHGATMGNAAANNDDTTVISPTEGVYYGVGTAIPRADSSDIKKFDVPVPDDNNDVLSCAGRMFEAPAVAVTSSSEASHSNSKKRTRDAYEHCAASQHQQQQLSRYAFLLYVKVNSCLHACLLFLHCRYRSCSSSKYTMLALTK
jgi:hypothetical protein